MKRIVPLLLAALLPACAHLGSMGGGGRAQLWRDAHQALASGAFAQADSLFARLADRYPDSEPGRESLFYRGAIRLDPRNPGWDPQPAEALLRRYLGADPASQGTLNRRPEGETLFQLAQQLNMPADERVPGLQPETRVETRVVRERVVVPASQSRALAGEVARLKEQLGERDAQIRRQQEELDRIRKTLTGRKQ
jgi:TolA-binding protein